MALRVLAARLQPALVLQDARAAVGQVARPVEPIQRLQLLDRVRLLRDADAVADDAVEVDEHAAAEQSIDLVFPRRVAAHQALHDSRLVRRVVVDVHGRVDRQPVHDQVDDLLERSLLVRWGVRPEGSEAGPAVRVGGHRVDHAPQVFEPVVGRERVALQVEEEVAR